MKKFIILISFILATLCFSAEKEPLTPGLWRFNAYLMDGTIIRQSICIDYKRFWRVSKLNRVPGCKARLVKNSKRRKVWSVKCKFGNRGYYRGKVIYAKNYFEQKYWGRVGRRSFRSKVIGRLKRAKICPYSKRAPFSKFLQIESSTLFFPLFGE